MTKFLGLTGSIGMGKSTTSKMFAEAGVPVYDADASVHALYAKGGAAVSPIGALFPSAIINGEVSRPALREIVLKDQVALSALNGVVHPLVAGSQIAFRQGVLENGAPLAVLDIPLLFETGGHKTCDYIAVVTAPANIQRNRVLARDSMSEAEFETILAKQVPDAEKRAQADFVISTAFGLEYAQAQVSAIIELMERLAKEETD